MTNPKRAGLLAVFLMVAFFAEAQPAHADGSVSPHYRLTGRELTCIVHHVRNGVASDETFRLMRASAD